MTPIFVIGNRNDHTLGRLICSSLACTYNVTYISGSRYSVQGSGYELVCFDCENPFIEGAENAIVIAKKEAALPEDMPAGFTVIFSTENSAQLDAVRKSRVFALDCGFSPLSTISFSGSSEEKLVISLNRSITALSGKKIQPLEIPVNKQGADTYTLMSFTALRLLLDDFESELGKLI